MKPLRDWDDLPDFMRTKEVRPYYDILKKHEKELYLKRAFDVVAALILIVLLAPIMLVVAILIKLDSPGPVFFRQTRITQYGKEFRIYKFRTMVKNAESIGTQVTTSNDVRITKIGSFIRKYRVDEFPQLFNVLNGDMSFVGTRPETIKYVNKYSPEYYATMLLPAGITSETSIRYKSEDTLLLGSDDIDKVYTERILKDKMLINLDSLIHFSLWNEILTLFRTVIAVLGKDYYYK